MPKEETLERKLLTQVSHIIPLIYTQIYSLTHFFIAYEPTRKRTRIDDVDIEDSQSRRRNKQGESEGVKESKPDVNNIMGELVREMRDLKAEVSRIYGDTASLMTIFCGDTSSAVDVAVGRHRGTGHCNLCRPRVPDRFLHELDPDQSSQFPGIQ